MTHCYPIATVGAKVAAVARDATYTNSFAQAAIAIVKGYHSKAKIKVGQV